MIKTRFAPSPTGWLHIGGVRTALFSWLFAKSQNGEFLVRIDDTDTTRSTQQYCDANGLNYVYITDITRQGIENPDLVAIDNLHPSTLAYSKFVERILPIAIEKLQQD